MINQRREHRQLKLSLADIALDSKKIKTSIHKSPQQKYSIHKQSLDPFISYKQGYQLPLFKKQPKHSTLDLKRRLKSLQNRPLRYQINSKLRSKSIIADDMQSNLIRKQLCTIDSSQFNDSTIKNHLDHKYLTQFQKQQIKKYKDVYYIGHKAYTRKYKDNFRDKDDNYKPLIGDHIAYRFEIIKVLGCGAFGKVLQVQDHKYHKRYALKILKLSSQLKQQFKLQIKILKTVKDHPSANKNIVEIKGDFQFRNHIVNTYQHSAQSPKCLAPICTAIQKPKIIKAQIKILSAKYQFNSCRQQYKYKGKLAFIQALLLLHNKGIIHCDIKPENVVFKQLGKSGVKLVDFGSACYQDKKQFTYIQSRYYRSPQIVLMKPYNNKIDVWSLGCLIFQIFTGTPLFPSRTEQQQMQMLLVTLGAPPKQFLSKCQRANQFDFSNYIGKPPKIPIRQRAPSAPPSMIKLMQQMVRWSPQQRPSIAQCLTHQFILQGLPKVVRDEHLKQMESNNPYDLY